MTEQASATTGTVSIAPTSSDTVDDRPKAVLTNLDELSNAHQPPRAPRRGAAEGREYNGAIEDRDGCTCPPWAICIHYDGRIVWLVNRQSQPFQECQDRGSKQFGVIWGSRVGPCSDGAHSSLHGSVGYFGYVDTDSLPAAEAEFRAREATLLGRAE